VPAVDEVVEGVRGGRLVSTLLDLTEADVVDDQQLGPSPGLQASGVGAVGEARVEVVEEIDAACVAHPDTLLASSDGKGLEYVTLACPTLARNDEVFTSPHEVEPSELEDQWLIETRLEVPVEGFERLALDETTLLNPLLYAFFEALRGLATENVLKECGRAGALVRRP
jgi:hypothetical protein